MNLYDFFLYMKENLPISLRDYFTYSKVSLKKRPVAVSIISIFYLLNALFIGFGGITTILIFLRVIPYPNGVDRPSNYLLSFSLSAGAVVLALFFIIIGWQLFQLKPQARQAAIILSSILIIPNLFIFIGRLIVNGQFSPPFSVIFHALVIWALFSKSVKVAFQPNLD